MWVGTQNPQPEHAAKAMWTQPLPEVLFCVVANEGVKVSMRSTSSGK